MPVLWVLSCLSTQLSHLPAPEPTPHVALCCSSLKQLTLSEHTITAVTQGGTGQAQAHHCQLSSGMVGTPPSPRLPLDKCKGAGSTFSNEQTRTSDADRQSAGQAVEGWLAQGKR